MKSNFFERRSCQLRLLQYIFLSNKLIGVASEGVKLPDDKGLLQAQKSSCDGHPISVGAPHHIEGPEIRAWAPLVYVDHTR